MIRLPYHHKCGLGKVAIHCGYHKCLTVYFTRVLEEAAKLCRTEFVSSPGHLPDQIKKPIFMLSHDSQVDLSRYSDYRCTHIIRDPRDLVVSAYYYHLRTTERWCARPNPDHKDLPADVSYQEHLKTLNTEDGLLYELANVSGRMIEYMHEWDYSNPNSLELRYESVVGNEEEAFREIFEWYEIESKCIPKLVRIARKYSRQALMAKADTAISRHIREDSHEGQWKIHFTNKVKDEFKQRYGYALKHLGYEKDDDW